MASTPEDGPEACGREPAEARLARPLLAGPIERSVARIARQAGWVDPAMLRRIVGDHLVERLAPVAAPTLVAELAHARDQGELAGPDPEHRFGTFVKTLADRHRVDAILGRYPALGPALDRMADDYAGFMIELLGRIADDWPLLDRAFTGGRGDALALRSIELAGDAHRRGRSVCLLTWTATDGDDQPVRWVYKPRDLTADRALGGLLDWLGPLAGDRYEHPIVIPRDEYGWCEYVPERPCVAAGEVEAFHHRLGGIAALLHLLLARDVHADNLIACGPSPVVIDPEGVMPPRFPFHRGPEHAPEYHLRLSLILPQRLDVPAGWLDPSAIGGMEGTGGPLRRAWRDAGTEGMRTVWRPRPPEPRRNRPVLHGRVVEPCDHEDAFTAGFSAAFDAIATNRKELAGPDSPLTAFRGAMQRVALRNTSIYRFLLERSWSAAAWREPADRKAVFDTLFDDVRGDGVFPMIAGSERDDLLNGDVPLFRTRTDAPEVLDARGRIVPLAAVETGFERVRRHLEENFTAEAKCRQLATIREAFAARRAAGRG